MTAIADLQAENTRLRAQVEQYRAVIERVEALASGAFFDQGTAPANGTLAVVETSGGWQDLPPKTRVYFRSDEPDSTADRDPYFPDGGDWFEHGPDVDDRPLTWGELNGLDDPACDRASRSFETFVSVEALDAALRGVA